MAKPKRADNDATMELSTSQLVPDALPRKRAPRPPISPNDVSMWKHVVVGSDDFAPPPAARPGRGRRWVLAGALGAGIAAGGAFAWYRLAGPSSEPPAAPAGGAPATTAPAPSPSPPPPPPAAPAALAPAAAPAAPAEVAEVAEPAPAPAEPAEPTWLEELAFDPTAVTWFEELGAGLALALAPGSAPAKATAKVAPAAPKRTAAKPAPKKPAAAPKKPAAAPKKPARPPPKRR
jgi:hypothetical protein